MIGIIWEKTEDDEKYEGDKFLLNQKREVFYKIIEGNDKDEIQTYEIDNFPDNLKEKMKIFFKHHNKIKQKIFDHEYQACIISNEDKFENSIEINEEYSRMSEGNNFLSKDSIEETEKIVYVKSFCKDEFAKFITLSNGIKQYIFNDKIEILISENKETIGYLENHKIISFIPLLNIFQNSNKDLISRLKYIKKTNCKEITTKIHAKLEENKNKNHFKEKDKNKI